jgi:hypothetical protein
MFEDDCAVVQHKVFDQTKTGRSISQKFRQRCHAAFNRFTEQIATIEI